MIDIRNLKLFPFIAKDLSVRKTNEEEKFNFIFYPENSTFMEAYPFLNIRRLFFRKVYILGSKLPMLLANMKLLNPFRTFKLLPVADIAKDRDNVFIDTSKFLDLIDLKFQKQSYRRPNIAIRIKNYLSSMKQIDPSRKNILVYYVDLNKKIPSLIYFRRSWPLFEMIKENENEKMPFEYFLLAMRLGESVKYSLLSNPEKTLAPARIYTILKGLEGNELEEENPVQNIPVQQNEPQEDQVAPEEPTSSVEEPEASIPTPEQIQSQEVSAANEGQVHSVISDFLKKKLR